MWGWVGEIFKSLVGPIFEAFRQWRAERTARQLGEQTQSNRDLRAGMDEARRANEARSGGRSDAELDKLLK